MTVKYKVFESSAKFEVWQDEVGPVLLSVLPCMGTKVFVTYTESQKVDKPNIIRVK